MAGARSTNVLIVWGIALAMLLLFSYDFLKREISSQNAGTLMVLLVAWFGWAVLTYAVRRGLFGVEGEEYSPRRKIGGGEPEVVERGPDGAWVKAREGEDEEEREELRRLDVTEALIDRHRVSIGAGEYEEAWVIQRERLVAAFEGQTLEDFKSQMSRRLGVGAFKYLVAVGMAENGLGAAEAIGEKFGEGFSVVAVYDAPMRYVIYEVREVVEPPGAWGMRAGE
jgi:hypothetical protein